MLLVLPYNVNLKTTVWVIVMGYLAIIGIFFLYKASKSSEEVISQKAMLRSIGLFFLLYLAVRFFFILSDYERNANGESLLYFRYVAISYIFQIIAFINIIYVFEKYIIKRTRYMMSISILIVLGINVIIIFFPLYMSTARYINYGLLYTEVAILVLLFLYLAIKTPGELRKNAIFTMIGLIILVAASFLDSDFLITAGIVQPYYSPIVYAIGATIFAYGYRQL